MTVSRLSLHLKDIGPFDHQSMHCKLLVGNADATGSATHTHDITFCSTLNQFVSPPPKVSMVCLERP
jgi:hypothetical protein